LSKEVFMPRKPKTIDPNSQKELLLNVLMAAEKRRSGVENKASIVLATNSILLAALGSFLNPSLLALMGKKSLDRISIYLIGAFIIFAVLSILSTLIVLNAIGPRRRPRIMRLPENEFNIFFVGKIAEFHDARAYGNAVKSLTAEGLIEQLTNQAYNVSHIVMNRYRWFGRALAFLLLSVILFPAIIIVTLAVH
jgi:hypothetical protein